MTVIKNNIELLKNFIEKLTIDYSYDRSDTFAFDLLIRASIIKCYEFLRFAFPEEGNAHYFVGISYLRSIIEDIIVLKSIQSIPTESRDILLRNIQHLEVNDRILVQWDFFQRYRPFQPVIDRAVNIEDAKIEIQKIWQENGWPNFKVTTKNTMPPIRQLAEKLAPGILDILYDFIYRLTSSTVHFSIQSLFRMSWGKVDGDAFNGTISTKNMSGYYETFSKIYGPLLFSFYFEFFSNEIGATEKEESLVQMIRKELVEIIRWPELITFEEMNLEVPKAYHNDLIPNKAIHKYFVEILKNGFVNKEFELFLNSIKTKP